MDFDKINNILCLIMAKIKRVYMKCVYENMRRKICILFN